VFISIDGFADILAVRHGYKYYVTVLKNTALGAAAEDRA
jgi:hypothetical protein